MKSEAFSKYEENTPFWHLQKLIDQYSIRRICNDLSAEIKKRIDPNILYAWRLGKTQYVPARYAVLLSKIYGLKKHDLNPICFSEKE